MLYLTTGDKFDTFTASHTMHADTASNGGFFVPFKMPKLDMTDLVGQSFCDAVALVLNQFFGTSITGKEIEFSIGRNPIRINGAHQRILVAELFRNLDGSYSRMVRRLAAKICNCEDSEVKITSWLSIAIRIAVLYGVFSSFENTVSLIDVAVPCGDFRLPMAVWYAREMGLPVGSIICACEQDSGVWDLLRQGQMRTSTKEVAFAEIERLICATLGVEEAVKYHAICDDGMVYTLEQDDVEKLNQGIFCAVVSKNRVLSAISNVYRTSSCVLDEEAAASYSGLMDYRAKTGESRTALILEDHNPED